MIVPNYLNTAFTDSNGNLTPQWSLLLDQLLRQMQINLSNEGFVIPSQNATNMNTIEPQAQNGTLLYDSTTGKLRIKLNDGTFHDILTS